MDFVQFVLACNRAQYFVHLPFAKSLSHSLKIDQHLRHMYQAEFVSVDAYAQLFE